MAEPGNAVVGDELIEPVAQGFRDQLSDQQQLPATTQGAENLEHRFGLQEYTAVALPHHHHAAVGWRCMCSQLVTRGCFALKGGKTQVIAAVEGGQHSNGARTQTTVAVKEHDPFHSTRAVDFGRGKVTTSSRLRLEECLHAMMEVVIETFLHRFERGDLLRRCVLA